MGRNRKWTLEKLQYAARGYRTRKEFRDRDPAAYGAAYANGMLEELELPPCKWYKERTVEEAGKYSDRNKFKKGSPAPIKKLGEKVGLMSVFRQQVNNEVCHVDIKNTAGPVGTSRFIFNLFSQPDKLEKIGHIHSRVYKPIFLSSLHNKEKDLDCL